MSRAKKFDAVDHLVRGARDREKGAQAMSARLTDEQIAEALAIEGEPEWDGTTGTLAAEHRRRDLFRLAVLPIAVEEVVALRAEVERLKADNAKLREALERMVLYVDAGGGGQMSASTLARLVEDINDGEASITEMLGLSECYRAAMEWIAKQDCEEAKKNTNAWHAKAEGLVVIVPFCKCQPCAARKEGYRK